GPRSRPAGRSPPAVDMRRAPDRRAGLAMIGLALIDGQDPVTLRRSGRRSRSLEVNVMRTLAAAAVAAVMCGTAGAAHAQFNYGNSVAVSDGFAFVTQPANVAEPGRVYVYQRGANGAWTEVARLTAPVACDGDGFGASSAAAGAVLVVAQPSHENCRGVALVFERCGDAWQHVARIVPTAAAANDSIG